MTDMADKILIDIKEVLGSSRAVSAEKGLIVYEKIFNEIDNGKVVELDFTNVTDLTTAFLNVAIGHLYNNFKPEQLNLQLRLINYSSLDGYLIKKVIQRVKMKNKELFEKNIKEDFESGRG